MGLISDVLSARQPLQLCPRFQTYCCLAANDVQGQKQTHALQKVREKETHQGHRLCRRRAAAAPRTLLPVSWQTEIRKARPLTAISPGCPYMEPCLDRASRGVQPIGFITRVAVA